MPERGVWNVQGTRLSGPRPLLYAVRARLDAWRAARFSERLWRHDHKLWSAEPVPEIENRLGWLDLPERMAGRIEELRRFADEVRAEGIGRVVLLGMGGSSLAPEVLQRTLGNAAGFPSLEVFDTTHPRALRDLEAKLAPGATLYLVSSKSGTTIETLSGFRYFWGREARASGKPGRRFVAITDPGTPLEALARERRGFGSVKGELRLLCNHLKAEVRTAADERFHAYHGEVAGRVTANLREAMAGWKGHLGRVTREFEGWLADAMMEEMGAVSLHGEGHLAGFLFRAQASVERSVRAFVDRLAREIERALGIRFEGARFDPQVEEPAHPDVRLSPTFDTYFELIWFLIPMRIFRPLVRRHFLRRIPWEVEKNLSRVGGQWADAMGASIDGLFRDATAFLEREVETIAGLVGEADAGNRGEEVRAALAELDGLESGVSGGGEILP
jgi:hypothetical protein